MTRNAAGRLGLALLVLSLSGCLAPEDSRPGLWLSGEATDFPSDWSFSAAHKEIGLQVTPPYFVAHSVIIWCVTLDDALFVAARDPDTKNWPGWVANRPEVKLGIAGKLYEARLDQLNGEETITSLRAAYAAKYELPPREPGSGPPMRYWRVVPRG